MEKSKLTTSQDVVKLLALDYAFALLACAKLEGLLEDGVTSEFVLWASKNLPKATKQDAQSTSLPVVHLYIHAAMGAHETQIPSNDGEYATFAEQLVGEWSNSSNETMRVVSGLINEQVGPVMQVTDRLLHTIITQAPTRVRTLLAGGAHPFTAAWSRKRRQPGCNV